MTTTDHTKVLKQLQNKPAKLIKHRKFNTPRKRSNGEQLHKCRRCGRTGGHISKYGIHLCRHCFRETAIELGFKKYS
jgi:small subunit ribosomal protein S14